MLACWDVGRVTHLGSKVDSVQLTVYVPPEVRRALKVEAAERGVSMGDIIVEALQTRICFLPVALRKVKPEEPT